jgi:hypothetical protein
MLFLILFVSAVVTICMVTVWSRPTEAKDPAASEPETSHAAEPESLEGVLVAQLLAGDISTTQYRHAIEGLAARDEDRHPLSVPPDLGPAQA